MNKFIRSVFQQVEISLSLTHITQVLSLMRFKLLNLLIFQPWESFTPLILCWFKCLTHTMHCGIHQITPPKLGLGQPLFPLPPTESLTPLHHTHSLFLLPPSRSLSSVSWACGMLLHCFVLGERSGWWGCPHLTRRFQVQPEAMGSRGWRWTIFLILSPFQNGFLSFSITAGAVEVITESAGGRVSPTDCSRSLLRSGF